MVVAAQASADILAACPNWSDPTRLGRSTRPGFNLWVTLPASMSSRTSPLAAASVDPRLPHNLGKHSRKESATLAHQEITLEADDRSGKSLLGDERVSSGGALQIPGQDFHCGKIPGYSFDLTTVSKKEEM